MGDTAWQDSQSRPQPQKKRSESEGFKPLGIPALTAAVQMSLRDSRPKARERDCPAFLRDDALAG